MQGLADNVPSMKSSRLRPFALLATLAMSISVLTNIGAAAVTGPTVTLVTPNSLTSLNPDAKDMNLVFNNEINYLQRSGFFYYDNQFNLIENRTLGAIKIVSERPFKVQYTVNSGRVWSDGTPITAVDLLLHHVICSSRYSVTANLGTPITSQSAPAFNSQCYGSDYDNRHVGLPQLSSDKMSLTIEFDTFFANWRQLTPKFFPVHAMVLLEEGASALRNETVSVAAKSRFEKAFYGYDTNSLAKYGKVWSNAFNINTVNSQTNPLLLVSNGGYQVESATQNQGVTLKYNERYNSGPAVQGIAKIVYKYIPDGTQAFSALQRKEVDIHQASPISDYIAQTKSLSGYRVIGYDQAVYEHLDLRTEKSQGSNDSYNGIFKGDSQRAKDLRRAFLLTIPRDEIVEKLIKPINSNAQTLDSLLYFSTESRYRTVSMQSGINTLTSAGQSAREQEALSLVRKYYPTASATNPLAKVNLLWGTPSNSRRSSAAQLIKAAAARAGFEVIGAGLTSWSTQLNSNAWDAAMFAWVRNDRNVYKNSDLYCTTCGNNFMGWTYPAVDAAYRSVANENLSESNLNSQLLKIEQTVFSEALSLPLFQHPGAFVVSNEISNVIPSANSAGVIWNYWEWSKNGSKEFPLFVANSSASSSNESTNTNSTSSHQNGWANVNWSTDLLGPNGYLEQKFVPLALGQVATNPPRWVGWNNLDFCWQKLSTYGTGKTCGRIGWGFWSQSGNILSGNFDFAIYDAVDFVKIESPFGSTCDRLGTSANLANAHNITCWSGIRIVPNHTYALKLMADTAYGANWWRATLTNETTKDVYTLGRIKSAINDNTKKLASALVSVGYTGVPKSCDDVPIIDTYMTNLIINGKQSAYAGFETGTCVKATVTANELSSGGYALRMGGQKPETRELIAENIQISSSDSKTSSTKPTTPSFAGVNFVGNKINVTVNIGSAAAARPEKVYLVAPKLGISGNNPLAGRISGSSATWSIDFDKVLSGTMIPLEIVGEKNGIKSDPLVGSYQVPEIANPITKAPAAPTNFKQRIIGNTILITAQAKLSANALASEAHLFGKSLGISKQRAISGEVIGSKVVIEVPIKGSMAGKKLPVTIYLSNVKGDSKPLNATLTIPAKPKPSLPTVAPKPSTTTETVLCFRGNQSRAFAGTKCPPGWEEK